MKQITIDRFDGIYAICEDKDKAFSIDVEETERRRARILEKQKKLMGL